MLIRAGSYRRVLRLLSRRLMRTRGRLLTAGTIVVMPAARGEPKCRVFVYQEVLRHLASGDQSRAVQIERLGLQDAHQDHRGAPLPAKTYLAGMCLQYKRRTCGPVGGRGGRVHIQQNLPLV